MVNCTLQEPNAPLTYLRTEDLDAFRPGSLIVDVSCDEGMGFSWAKTTTFGSSSSGSRSTRTCQQRASGSALFPDFRCESGQPLRGST